MRRRAVLGAAFLPVVGRGSNPLATGPSPLAPFPSMEGGIKVVSASRQWGDFTDGRTVRFPELGAVVLVEVADTPETRALGLGGHAPLEDGQGMLFVFGTRGRYPFWMKGMTFALDMLWLDAGADADGWMTVVHVAPDVAPDAPGTPDADRPTYAPPAGTTAKFVLEVPAGWAQAWGVDVGASALWQ